MNQKASTPDIAPATSVWLGFAEQRSTSQGTIRIHLRWKRICALILVLSTLGWMGKSVALYFFFKSVRGFDEVSFVDMLAFPINRASVRRAQGDYQVGQAQGAMERQDVRRAMLLLQQGIARSPGNIEGRVLLAQLYLGWRPDLAVQLMENGLDYGRNDVGYMRTCFQVFLHDKEDAKLLALTEDILSRADTAPAVRQLTAINRMQVAILRGRYDLAENVYQAEKLYTTIEGLLIATDMMLRVDDRQTATGLLEAIVRTFPKNNLDPVFLRLIQAYRQADDLARARERAIEYTIRNPQRWQARITLAEILAESGDDNRLNREVDAILREFRNEERAMLALGQIAADRGKTQIGNRLYELALENNFNLGVFSLLLIESYVKAGHPGQAIDYCNELLRENPAWLSTHDSVFNGIRSLAFHLLGNVELGSLYLRDFRSSRRTSVAQLAEAASSFQRNGFEESALSLYKEAHNRDPENELVLANLITLKLKLGDSHDLNRLLSLLMSLRRPPYRLLESIHQQLSSDRFIFTADRPQLLDQLAKIIDEPRSREFILLPPARQAARADG
jgi:predicted Zn-dependent protease